MLRFLTGARDLPTLATLQLEPVLQSLIQAVTWANDLIESTKPPHAQADHMLRALAAQNKDFMPVEVRGMVVDASSLESALVLEGHAMLMDLQRNDQGLVNFTSYKTGLGVDTWHAWLPGSAKDTRRRFTAVFEVRDIVVRSGG